MNTQYIEYLKTLDIPEDYAYIACDPDRKIYAFFGEPYFNIYEWCNALKFIDYLPDNIQIDNFADTLVEVKDIKVDKISTESLLNEYNEINQVLSKLIGVKYSTKIVTDMIESLKTRKTEIEKAS